MRARAVMVLGCTSGAGKSWLTAALCRLYLRRGFRVAPFKAQNMSNHARVVALADGGTGEIGSAQYFQALAAGVVPDVRMNPVLLKPETDIRSQVVVLGHLRHDLRNREWRERSEELWKIARAAYDGLSSEHDLIIIEGAGSPAEINLASSDYVNTGTARASSAACLLVADIDRGGAFAHLWGTHQLMDAHVRGQVRGFVLNRFRGDPALLAPGPQALQTLTGVPTLAVIPFVQAHGLPEEDAVPADLAGAGCRRFVVVAAPHASNLDEFEPLRAAGVQLSFARDPSAVRDADWLILPGSKQTRADRQWLRERGMDSAIFAHIEAGRPLLGICGGLQMLGERLEDEYGLESGCAGEDAGLGVLPILTTFTPQKHLSRVRARFGELDGAWRCVSGLDIDGYEIRLGRSRASGGAGARTALVADNAEILGWNRDSVLGISVHGLFENPAVLKALAGTAGGGYEAAFDRIADVVDASFAPGTLESLLERKQDV